MTIQNQSQEKFKTLIGGQALIEGILMQGPDKRAVVVRGPEGLREVAEYASAIGVERARLLGTECDAHLGARARTGRPRVLPRRVGEAPEDVGVLAGRLPRTRLLGEAIERGVVIAGRHFRARSYKGHRTAKLRRRARP